uniref:hypothetical protein n=1 Tax=Jatropha curcas TaxID=180498 RepID=UPI00279F6B73|nr:hypothetical protein QLP06_mgp002 [Jatropha curcas]WFG81117.1 hypothetical protein [Jatropha curcas]
MLSTLLHWFAYSYVPSRGSEEARTSTLSTSSRSEGNSEFANIHSPGILPPIGSEFPYAQLTHCFRGFAKQLKEKKEMLKGGLVTCWLRLVQSLAKGEGSYSL